MPTELLFVLVGLGVGLLIAIPSLAGPTANRRVSMRLALPIAIFIAIAAALFPLTVQLLRSPEMAALVWSIAVALVVLVYVVFASRRIASHMSSRRSSSKSPQK